MVNIDASLVAKALFWKYLERFSVQIVQFFVQVALARLLMPEDFGLIALIVVFVSISQVIIQSGFSAALVQDNYVTEADYSSVFYLSMAGAAVLYVLLFAAAPIIADFYGLPVLSKILRVLSLTLFFGVFNSIQNAIISRNFKFKSLFYGAVIAITCSGGIGVCMAYAGYGVWALVVQQLAYNILICAVLFPFIRWFPMPVFSVDRVRVLFGFGWKMLLTALIDSFYLSAQSLIIGKMFSAASLGFYNRGLQIPQLLANNIDGSIQSVMFPAYSREQGNPERLKHIMRKTMTLSAFVTFPLMIALIILAEPLIRLIFTDKWLPSVPFFQIYCVYYMLAPLQRNNMQVIIAMGRSDIFLRLELMKKTVSVLTLCIAIFYFHTLQAIAWSVAVSGIICTLINAHPNKRLLRYDYFEQLKDLAFTLLASVLMGVLMYLVYLLKLPLLPALSLQVVLGVVTYVAMSYFTKNPSFLYLWEWLTDKRGRVASGQSGISSSVGDAAGA